MIVRFGDALSFIFSSFHLISLLMPLAEVQGLRALFDGINNT